MPLQLEPGEEFRDDRWMWKATENTLASATLSGNLHHWRGQAIRVIEAELLAALDRPDVTKNQLRRLIREVCGNVGDWGTVNEGGSLRPKTAADASRDAMNYVGRASRDA